MVEYGMEPQFLYFDMGNVLLRFSHERMAQQMAGVAGTDRQTAWRILFEDGLEWAYERGELTREQFYGRFCEAAGVALADIEALDAAGNDIFELNAPIVGLVGRLFGAGYRLGVCSNTTLSHWNYCARRFAFLTTMFSVHALSYGLGAMKPDPQFFSAATRLARVPAEDIFFTDDRTDNVAAAKAAGWDAVLFESVSQLNQALRNRGIVMNY
jgi:putative hydrolase of the HAD superfamily